METFKKIAATKGNNSVNEKLKLMNSLLFDSTNEESKYIARWLYGSLKLGAAEKTFISALARAICLTPPNQKYVNIYIIYIYYIYIYIYIYLAPKTVEPRKYTPNNI